MSRNELMNCFFRIFAALNEQPRRRRWTERTMQGISLEKGNNKSWRAN